MQRRAPALKHLSAHYDQIEEGIEDLAFCRKVYRAYVEEGKTSQQMDADKATAQMLATIDRLLVAGR